MESSDKICSNEEANQQLTELYNLIMTNRAIQYKPNNLKEYFEKIYRFMTLKNNEKFLRNVECFNMYNFYIYLCNKLGMVESENHSDIEDIPPNSVISLKVPAVPGEYHYITIVISVDKKLVDIYQSYGGTRILYLIENLPFKDFKKLLNDCKLLADNKTTTYYNDMLKLRRIARVFSRIMNLECKALENEQQYFDYDYSEDIYEEDEDEQDDKVEEPDPQEDPKLEKLMDINFPAETIGINEDDRNLGFTNIKAIDIIRKDYEKFKHDYSFSMKIFTPPLSGGKKKRKSKTHKKILKKIKRHTKRR